MNDQPRSDVPSGLPEGPPWSVDTLADIHAGVYPPAMTAILRHQILMDPEAAAVLKALDSLTADLQDLSPIPSEAGNESRGSVPDIVLPPMPAEFASRLDEALSAEVNARFANRTTQPVWPAQRAAAPSAPRSGQPHEQNRPSEPTPVVGPPSWQTSGSSDNSVSPHAGSPNAGSPDVISLEAARRKRRTTWVTAIGGIAAAAVIGTVVVIGIGGNQTGGSADSAAAPPAQTAPPAGSAAASEAPDDEGDAAAENEPAPAATNESSAAAEATSSPTQPAPSVSRLPTSTSTSPSSSGSSLPATAPGAAAPEFEIDLLVLDPETVADAYDKIAGRNIAISESGETAVMDNPDLGPISDPEVYDGCVAANGVGNDVLVGLRMAIYEGQIGYAIALNDPFNPTLSTILVVGAECGPDNADLLVRVPAQR